MKKGLLSHLVIMITISLLGAFSAPTAVSAETITLNYANFPPASTFPCVQMERWKQVVEERTKGKVKVNTFPGGTLLNAKHVMDGVISGVADIGSLCMAYQPGRFTLTNAAGLPLGVPDARVASLILWNLYEKYNPKAFSKVKVLTMFNTYPANIMSKKPVRNLDDLRGMELRASGMAAAALKLWGATPVGMPMPQTPEALQKGVVQGLFSSGETMKDFKFAEFCRYMTMTKRVSYPFAVVMNKNAWNKLPDDVKKVFDDLGRDQAVWTGEYVDRHVVDALEWSKKNYNVEIITLPKEEMAKWDELLKPLVLNWSKDAKKKGLPAEDILKDLKMWTQKYAAK